MSTIRDVAFEARCSPATVSRALKGDPRISAATKFRVRSVAQRLDYRTNTIARSLRQSSTRTIGFLVPHIASHDYTVGTSLMYEAFRHIGYRLVLSCHDENQDDEVEALKVLLDQRVDAIVHVPSTRLSAQQLLGHDLNIPIIEFLRHSKDTCNDAAFEDGDSAAYTVTQYLIDLGHERIAFVAGNPATSTTEHRASGFRQATRNAGFSPKDCPIAFGVSSSDWGRTAAANLLDSGINPTAFISCGPRTAIGIVSELNRRHVLIPHEVSVIAFTRADWYQVADPPLTSYETSLEEMARKVVEFVLGQVRRRDVTQHVPTQVGFEGCLIVRSSTMQP